MISEIMQVMVERAPKKARMLQKQGQYEAYVRGLVKTAKEEIAAQNVPESDPNRQAMVREIAMAGAMEEALSGLEDETT